MLERRKALGGSLPRRRTSTEPLPAPAESVYTDVFAGADLPASTTMAFGRLLRNLVRDPDIGKRVVPIIPDEARTFGMDPLFKELGIYNPLGQRYAPVDRQLLLSYREATDGQILEEGITEAGSMASFTAAGTAYAIHGQPMIPFYVFYSMFGLQRTGDQVWAFGDARGRGFMLGATAGRTTLTGEGLQHDDGQSHLYALAIPNLQAYDPAFAYELGVIVRDGIRRMWQNGEDVFYYITLYNENWTQPPLPEGVAKGIVRGLYRYRAAEGKGRRVQLLGSGSILHQVIRAADLLAEQFGVAADVWSATSFQQLRADALRAERHNRLHPDEEAWVPYLTRQLADAPGPVIAATDYVKAVPDMIARWVDRPYVVLGTDGFGRSDTREALRTYFEVSPEHIAYAALVGLTQSGEASIDELTKARASLGIDPDRGDPAAVEPVEMHAPKAETKETHKK
jgi:pyruvate dehydrogenase E1 component